MPPSGPVYQPTTVTYEQQDNWAPVSYISQTVSNVNRSKCIQWLILVTGLCLLAIGLIMMIEGAVDYADTEEHVIEDVETPTQEKEKTGDLVIAIIGALLCVVAFALLGLYVRNMRRRKGCPCFPGKEQRMARQLDNQGGNGQILTLNPSTDLLVTAQYGPVSEIAYQPPAVSDEEETRKLMGSDNKECSPPKTIASRIRKISSSSRFQTRRLTAPLAGEEEITPSLRSSFASVYYPITPYDSSLSLESFESVTLGPDESI